MKPCFAFALFFFVTLRLAAQDVTVNGPSWVDPKDPPDQLPVVKTYTPDYPERLKGSTEIGYLVVDSFIYAQGELALMQCIGTDPSFTEVLQTGDWRTKPAKRDGKPVNSVVRHTFIFNPTCAGKRKSDATPRLLSVVVPEVPRGLGKNAPSAKLYVTVSVDASGQVTKAVADAGAPEALGQLAEDAVLKWSFAPARKNGQPVAQDVRVPVMFLKAFNLDAKADTPPRLISHGKAIYPSAMKRAGMRGDVVVRFVVDIEGQVRNPFVISSTNPGFDQAAIDMVVKSHFEPARRKGVPVNTRMQVPIDFQLDEPGGGDEAYAISDWRPNQGKLPSELRYDLPPKLANAVFAVYPFELLRDGVGGTAEVKFLVSPGGKVNQATVIEATRPEFGQALLAMLDEWKFKPAMKEGKPTWSLMDIKQEFADFGGEVPVGEEALDLLDELKKKQPAFCAPKNLDAPLQLISSRAPVFPTALNGKVSDGQAVVEFLIDHDGKVQLPRVVSATDPAFGYAAVQGVAAWRFAPPVSHGKSVNLLAQIPMKFTASKPAPPPAQN